MKCTITERGRMINLKQAHYKPLKISGKLCYMSEDVVTGLRRNTFLALARCIERKDRSQDQQIGVFTSKHSVDMKCLWLDNRYIA